MSTNHNTDSIAELQRVPYQAPQLTIFGSVRSLTASGTGAMTEGPGVGNNGPDRVMA